MSQKAVQDTNTKRRTSVRPRQYTSIFDCAQVNSIQCIDHIRIYLQFFGEGMPGGEGGASSLVFSRHVFLLGANEIFLFCAASHVHWPLLVYTMMISLSVVLCTTNLEGEVHPCPFPVMTTTRHNCNYSSIARRKKLAVEGRRVGVN